MRKIIACEIKAHKKVTQITQITQIFACGSPLSQRLNKICEISEICVT